MPCWPIFLLQLYFQFMRTQVPAKLQTDNGLEFCGKEEGIEHDYATLHEATSDILLMMKVYWKRLYQLEF